MKRYQMSFGYDRAVIRQYGEGSWQALRNIRQSMKQQVMQAVPREEEVRRTNWYGHTVQGIRVMTVEVLCAPKDQ